MGFNQEVHLKLDEIFIKNNLKIIEERENYFKLESLHLKIILTYNPYERSCNFYIYTISSVSKTIDFNNSILTQFFKSKLHINFSDIKSFVNSLAIFFEKEGQSLLEGDIDQIRLLEEFSFKKDKK